MTLSLVDEAIVSGARLCAICKQIKLTARTLQRWRLRGEGGGQDLRRGPKTRPKNALSEQEVASVLAVANSTENCDLSPRQIVPRLADEGIYIASESTFYRVLEQHGHNTHRGPTKPRTSERPVQRIAKLNSRALRPLARHSATSARFSSTLRRWRARLPDAFSIATSCAFRLPLTRCAGAGTYRATRGRRRDGGLRRMARALHHASGCTPCCIARPQADVDREGAAMAVHAIAARHTMECNAVLSFMLIVSVYCLIQPLT